MYGNPLLEYKYTIGSCPECSAKATVALVEFSTPPGGHGGDHVEGNQPEPGDRHRIPGANGGLEVCYG